MKLPGPRSLILRVLRRPCLVFLGAGILAGCVSDPAPNPRPPAVREAAALAEDARRLAGQSRWSAAAARWRETADRFALLNDRAGEAIARHNLAIAQKQMGDLDAALRSAQAALELNASLPRQSEWWRNQIAILQIKSQLGQTREVNALFADLAPRMGSVEDSATLGLLLNEMGLWQWRGGRLAEAGNSLDQAREHFTDAGNASGLATVTANQALVLESEEKWEEASGTWRDALRQFESLGDPHGIAASLAGLGRSLLETGQTPEDAKELLRRAARSYRLLNLPDAQAAVEKLLKTASEP